MSLKDNIFKHFEIDEGMVEKLIEMWRHFNPKDDPTPLPNGKVFLNKSFPEVTSESLGHVLAEKIFNSYWHNRYYVQCFEIRLHDPIQYMYDHYIGKFKGEKEEKEKVKLDDLDGQPVTKKEKVKPTKVAKTKKK